MSTASVTDIRPRIRLARVAAVLVEHARVVGHSDVAAALTDEDAPMLTVASREQIAQLAAQLGLREAARALLVRPPEGLAWVVVIERVSARVESVSLRRRYR